MTNQSLYLPYKMEFHPNPFPSHGHKMPSASSLGSSSVPLLLLLFISSQKKKKKPTQATQLSVNLVAMDMEFPLGFVCGILLRSFLIRLQPHVNQSCRHLKTVTELVGHPPNEAHVLEAGKLAPAYVDLLACQGSP